MRKSKNIKKHKKDKIAGIPRFHWIAITYILILVCILFARYYNSSFTDKWDFVVCCAGWGLTNWFLFDYEMLQIGKYYLFSLILSLIHLIFAQIIFHNADTGTFKDFSMLQPLLLLLFQYPMRKIFIFLMEREPMPDRVGPWQDRIYGLIILGGSFLPLIVVL